LSLALGERIPPTLVSKGGRGDFLLFIVKKINVRFRARERMPASLFGYPAIGGMDL
jgi:hypothetical protein